MPETWATSGVDLHLERVGTRVRGGLEASLRQAIRRGRLRPGTRLPPSRALAADLGLARNTVADAYGQLVAEGWLAARRGSGTWVAQRTAPAPLEAAPPADGASRARYDLRPGTPDLSAFPRSAWLAATRRALATAPYDVLGYGDPRGVAALRTALAEYLARARGVAVAPDRVVVCAGFAEALELLCEVLRGRGATTLAMEAFGLHQDRRIAEARGLRTTTLPVDEGGAAVDRLDATDTYIYAGRADEARDGAAVDRLDATDAGGADDARAANPGGDTDTCTGGDDEARADASEGGEAAAGANPGGDTDTETSGNRSGVPSAVLLTPAHQFPIGVALAPHRRRQVIDWAGDTGALVIEDDYDGEFRYDRRPIGAMQALAPEHVVYAGTASKSLAPGLRLGWLVLPSSLIEPVVEAKARIGRHSSSLDQLTLAELIGSGAYDWHVRRSRLAYQRRRDRLTAVLRDQVPGVRVTGIDAGLHALVELPDGQHDDEVVRRAAEHGLALDGLGTYRRGDQPHGPSLVVGYATPPDHAFSAALARLGAVLSASL